MNDIAEPQAAAGQRGPADHNIRDQIVTAAEEHFSHYGYQKTTVSDLAKAIGFSKAYIYKFFDSKQAIGEAICTRCLDTIVSQAAASVAEGRSATDKLRRLFKVVVDHSLTLFFEERRLHDIAAASSAEKWQSGRRYCQQVEDILAQIILEGRESGEFERKTPLDETARAIMNVMQPFMHPIMLEFNLDLMPAGPNEAISLILRSLAP
jgi:AcrR family transcriptional regulator